MAKTSKIVKNNKRKRTIEVYAEKRQDLLKIVKDPNTSYEEKKRSTKKRLHVCLEMLLQQDIETDVKLPEDLEELSGNSVCPEILLET
jgi:hypothetical protein